MHPSTIISILAIAASAAASALPNQDLAKRELKQCPALNNYIWTSPSGASKWKIGCDRDTVSDGDHAVQIINGYDLEDCIKICGDANHVNWCKSVSFKGDKTVNDPGTCYLKGSGTGGTTARDGWRLAVKQ